MRNDFEEVLERNIGFTDDRIEGIDHEEASKYIVFNVR